MATDPKLTFVAKRVATAYEFRGEALGWAICTINDATGELSIQSDWGNWSHRWSPDPENLGAPTLTAFIGGRGDVDYIARKLQNEGRSGVAFSVDATAGELCKRLCERRLSDGREQLEYRLDTDGYDCGRIPNHLSGRYSEAGFPLFSYENTPAPTWRDPGRTERVRYLTKDVARLLWQEIRSAVGGYYGNPSGFYESVLRIDGFTDYVTDEPWHYHVAAQTPEDKALRDLVLPALISKLREGM